MALAIFQHVFRMSVIKFYQFSIFELMRNVLPTPDWTTCRIVPIKHLCALPVMKLGCGSCDYINTDISPPLAVHARKHHHFHHQSIAERIKDSKWFNDWINHSKQFNYQLVKPWSFLRMCDCSQGYHQIYVFSVVRLVWNQIIKHYLCALGMSNISDILHIWVQLHIFYKCRNVVSCNLKWVCVVPVFHVIVSIKVGVKATVLISSSVGNPHVVSSICKNEWLGLVTFVENPHICRIDQPMHQQSCRSVYEWLAIVNSEYQVDIAILGSNPVPLHIKSCVLTDLLEGPISIQMRMVYKTEWRVFTPFSIYLFV